MALIEKNGPNNRIQHLITIGTKYSLVTDGKGGLALDNLNVESHSRWSQTTWFEVQGTGGSGGGGSGHGGDDDTIAIIWPKFDTTTRWPPMSPITEGDDGIQRTRPAEPPHPQPPPPPGPASPRLSRRAKTPMTRVTTRSRLCACWTHRMTSRAERGPDDDRTFG